MEPLPRAAELLHLVREARSLLSEAGAEGGLPKCPACQATPPLEAAFCTGCGARLRFPCPRCEAACRAGTGHCGACGLSLAADVVEGQLAALAQRDDEERARRERDLLRRYAKTRVIEEGRVRHLLGTLPDGGQEFVKVAASEAGRRLLRNELDALARIGPHPGVVRLLEQRETEDALVAAFEHVASEPLRFPLAIPALLDIVSRTLATLVFVHERGVIHADLKPAHVLLRGGAPVLIDWNVAQEPGPSRFGAFTPLFAAPEQVVGDRLDARVDVYALGVILYLLFTHDRFPAVLEEREEQAPLLDILGAKKAQNRAFLAESTVYQGRLAQLQKSSLRVQNQLHVQQAQSFGPADADASEGLEERRVLGAKYLFSCELGRTQDVNADIRLTGEVLAIVRRATAVDREDRFPTAAAMREAVEAARARCGPAGQAC